jgi:hypothetical protein
MRKAPLVIILALALVGVWGEEGGSTVPPVPNAAQDGQATAQSPDSSSPYRVTSDIDWGRRVLVIDISLDFKKAGLALPEGRLTAERMVARDLPGLAKEPLFALPLDSEGRLGERVIAGEIPVEAILGLAHRLTPISGAMSRDMLSFRSKWEMPLSAAAALVVTWKQVNAIPPPLDWAASKTYTGIVIYADRPLPVHGERGVVGTVHRSLFPRIFDDNMGIVMDRWVVDPKVLVESGPLGYVTQRTADDEVRVGDEPLLVRATGLFGVDRSDILINPVDAARILSDPADRELFAQGRVIVVVPRDRMAEP